MTQVRITKVTKMTVWKDEFVELDVAEVVMNN